MSANDQNGCEGMNKEEEKLEGQKNKQTNKQTSQELYFFPSAGTTCKQPGHNHIVINTQSSYTSINASHLRWLHHSFYRHSLQKPKSGLTAVQVCRT